MRFAIQHHSVPSPPLIRYAHIADMISDDINMILIKVLFFHRNADPIKKIKYIMVYSVVEFVQFHCKCPFEPTDVFAVVYP